MSQRKNEENRLNRRQFLFQSVPVIAGLILLESSCTSQNYNLNTTSPSPTPTSSLFLNSNSSSMSPKSSNMDSSSNNSNSNSSNSNQNSDEEARIEQEEEERLAELERKRPKGTISDVTVSYDVFRNNQKGILISVDFTVDNLKDTECELAAYFYYASGSPLKDFNNSYKSSDGQVSVGKTFTPKYVGTEYTAMELFIPTSEMHLTDNFSKLKFQVSVNKKSGGKIAGSNFNYFETTVTRNSYSGDSNNPNSQSTSNYPRQRACGVCRGTGTIDNCWARNSYDTKQDSKPCSYPCTNCGGDGIVEY